MKPEKAGLSKQSTYYARWKARALEAERKYRELRPPTNRLVNGFAWSAVQADCPASAKHLNKLLDDVRAAIKSAESVQRAAEPSEE